uniref:TIR domain-containing protein n=1 Tax=Candidatus Kentrum sp. FW TaxID=2126338 RepID=A0A450TEK8_9GAMM|nr:MAG: TIR domain-containing protein [Candidatus Kentron sp. FW]
MTFDYGVFPSHANADKPVVRKLAERLRGDGLEVWFDEWIIRPGDSIPLAMERGLERARILVLVLVMSKHSVGRGSGSEWVALECHTVLYQTH